MNMRATLLIASVLCMPAACLAAQSDWPEASVRPSIILVDGDETEFSIDLSGLSDNASFQDCISYTTDKCSEKYGTGGNDACASQYLAVCTEKLDACNREGRTDCEQ